MRITSESLQISPSDTISWEEIKTIRLRNEKLDLVLTDGRTIELTRLLPSTIDLVFRTYEKYLKDHSDKRLRP